jgi:hypothetical protein
VTHDDDRDPLRDAGSRLRGALDPHAFDPDWAGRAQARRRSRATAVASVAAALAIVVGGVAAVASGDDDGGGSGDVVATAPDTVPTPATEGTTGPTATSGVPDTTTATPGSLPTTPVSVATECVPVSLPFRATVVPEGWFTQAAPWSRIVDGAPGWSWAAATGRSIDALWGTSPFPQTNAEPITVMGEAGTIGDIHEGFSVEVPLADAEPPCDPLVLVGYGISRDDLRAFAEGLVPIDLDPDGEVAVVVSFDGLLGWWDGAAWQDVDARSPEVPVEPGTEFTVVGIGRETTSAVGGAGEPFCETMPTYSVPLEPPLAESWRVPGQIAVSATWDLVPRAPTELDPAGQAYVDATAEIVADLGVPDAPAHLDQVVRGDLDGDGVDEVLLVGRHPDADPSHGPRAGWYSFVALRSVVDGEVRTDVLEAAVFEEDYDSYPTMTTYQLDALADLNGDGRMEIVYGGSLFEGASTHVVEWTGPGDEPEQVLSARCGA